MDVKFISRMCFVMVGYVWGQMNQKAYIDGMKAQCEVMVEKAYNAGLYGCVD